MSKGLDDFEGEFNIVFEVGIIGVAIFVIEATGVTERVVIIGVVEREVEDLLE